MGWRSQVSVGEHFLLSCAVLGDTYPQTPKHIGKQILICSAISGSNLLQFSGNNMIKSSGELFCFILTL